jgi:hypothetical protein
MAEQVQTILDAMVAPLQDLLDRGIFTKSEVHLIVERRKVSEYHLQRRGSYVRLVDYIEYIQAEDKLERLRELRTKQWWRKELEEKRQRLSADQQHSNVKIKQPHHIGDIHVKQHLHLLWDRTLRKFGRTETNVWLAYFEFCQRYDRIPLHNDNHDKKDGVVHRSGGGGTKLATAYTKALSLHPTKVEWWIAAASHAYFTQGSVRDARIMLQRGIRICPSSTALWLQAFVVELHFVQKLHGRKQILYHNTDPQRMKDLNDDDTKNSVMQQDNMKDYKLARLVFDNAIQTLAGNHPKNDLNKANNAFDFRINCFDQCGLFPHTDELRLYIMESIHRDCCADPAGYIALATYWKDRLLNSPRSTLALLKAGEAAHVTNNVNALSNNSTDNATVAILDKSALPLCLYVEADAASTASTNPLTTVLREALTKLPTEAMFLQLIAFLQVYLDEVREKLHAEYCCQEPKSKKRHRGDVRVKDIDESAAIQSIHDSLEHIFLLADNLQPPSWKIVLAYVEYRVPYGLTCDVVSKLESFVSSNEHQRNDKNRIKISASFWIRYAIIASDHNENNGSTTSRMSRDIDTARRILRQGTDHLLLEDPDHTVLLLQLLGTFEVKTFVPNMELNECWSIFNKILMLAPGHWDYMLSDANDAEHSFGIRSIADACLHFLRLIDCAGSDNIQEIRNLYNAVLVRSSIGRKLVIQGCKAFIVFVDECIKAERNAHQALNNNDHSAAKKLLQRMIELSAGTSYSQQYRHVLMELQLAR